MGAPTVEKEQLDPRKLVDEPREATVETSQGEVFEQTRHTQIEHGMIKPGGLSSEGCACRKSNPNILVMQPAQDWKAKNTPCSLNRAR